MVTSPLGNQIFTSAVASIFSSQSFSLSLNCLIVTSVKRRREKNQLPPFDQVNALHKRAHLFFEKLFLGNLK